MKVSQKEKLHCTALPGGPTGNILIAKLDWIERIGAPRRSVGLRMWSNRCKFHHANQPWRVERKGGQEGGRRKGSNPSLPLLSPSFLQFRLSSLCQAEIRSCGFTAPRFRMCVRYVLHSTSLRSRPLPGRDAEAGGRLAQKRASEAQGRGLQVAKSLPRSCRKPSTV